MGTARLGVVCVAAADLTIAAAAVDLCSHFLGLAVSLVAVTIGCSCAFVTG